MRNPLRQLSKLGKEQQRYWGPTLISVGAGMSYFGVSQASKLGLYFWTGLVAITVGLGLVWWGAILSWKSGRKEELTLSSSSLKRGSGRRSFDYKDIRHEVLTDKQEPYYMGESVGFQMKLTNLLDEPCTRKFYYMIQLPDGMYLHRPHYPIDFAPRQTKVIPLGDPVFLAFLGIFRLVIVTDEAERLLIEEKVMATQITFQTLFAGYSRDKEGYELQKQMVRLSGNIRLLTIVLVVLTLAVIGFSVFAWLASGWSPS